MTMTQDTLSAHLERLRALLTLLAFAQDGQRHAELLEQIRAAVANVRKSRTRLGRQPLSGMPSPS
jgi:hypothetical protein